jgi:N-acetyl sugar amidotransferase
MRTDKEYRICSRCIIDTSDPEIVFDGDGVCNHCREYDLVAGRRLFLGEERQRRLEAIVARIKERGRGKEYDCVIGLSGGVDSSFLALKAVELGLRPLAVHLDNGWNSELAVGNIERIVKKLRIDLHTHVIDWEEFRDLQLAFLRASVIDIEMLTDHAIAAAIYRAAAERGIRFFLSGENLASESVLPRSWCYSNKRDSRNIRAIWRKYGSGRSLRTFPLLSAREFFSSLAGRKVNAVLLLDYLPYHKESAKQILIRDLGWTDYGGKHHESRFTKFYQAYILPEKFGIDKRRAHLSSLIHSGQITRESALEQMEEKLYGAEELREDKEFVAKKFGLSVAEFDGIMSLPPRDHGEFPNYDLWLRLATWIRRKVPARGRK